jgi:3-oxoacyl-(acyl-carrier-protein) reductase
MSEDGGSQTAAPPAAGTGPRSLEGRVAIVTGGNRGIGAAIARALGAHGATVAVGYSSNTDQAEEFKSELEGEGHHASVHQGNVGNTDDTKRVVEEVMDQHGRVDILVNNAGITADKPLLKMEEEEWQRVLNVNLSGAFHMCKPVLEHMIERGSGRIVNIASVVGQQGNIGQANYAAAKSGLFGLTMTMAREAAHALGKADNLEEGGVGLTVNTIAPGFIATDMTKDLPEKVVEQIKGTIPLGRLGHPDEIARVVRFLCEDESGYITGQIWSINGGMEMT